MSHASKAAEDIKSFASRVRSFLEVADALEKIGSLEQAESEALVKADRARQEGAAAEAEANKKKADLAKVDEEIEYARKSAEEIVSNAKTRAMAMLDEAGVKANETVRMASDRKSSVESEILTAGEKLRGLLSTIAEKESVLKAVNSKIEEAREKVASLFKS